MQLRVDELIVETLLEHTCSWGTPDHKGDAGSGKRQVQGE